jgi:hypothetical protein
MNLIGIVIVIILLVAVFVSCILWILKKRKGSIEIIPEKHDYISREYIKGKVILKLKKPVKSKKLIMGLKCERSETTYSGKERRTENYAIFEFNQPLDEEKEYAPGEYSYDFSIKVPGNFSKEVEGVAGTLVKSIQVLSAKDYLLKWYLYAELQCEGVDLSKEVQINVN